ncbi:hypothetical protein AB4Y32_16290 [Paraburkholderia phymatum]|uniref:Uncharacterized protein n=1 Tax=Paraburkholderia phymatum TaxID=148447 RepID=A0ACC6U176_9BURK
MTCDQQRFKRDVADHVMTIVRDDGVDRHIKFGNKDGGSPYWFEILTWAGTLCIHGDCGTFVFSRLTDMFKFFRTDRGNDPSKLYINEGYWCEKLQAVDCNGYGKGAARKFDPEEFKSRVKEHVESYLEGYEITDERRADLWDSIHSEILGYVDNYSSEYVAFHRMHEFHDDEFPELFTDCWEWDCDEYTFRFLWNLYAIAWAIRKYDAAKAEKRAA